MNAQPAIHDIPPAEDEMLDADTSAAILHWLETGLVPAGVDPDQWEVWADAGCRGTIESDGAVVTPAMLGCWARTGNLR